MSVTDFAAVANTLLGGGSNGFNLDDIASLTETITLAFFNGSPSTFAQDHLINGPCP